jgi:hypothetical protein
VDGLGKRLLTSRHFFYHVRVQGGNPAFMQKMVEKGFLGRKAEKGFYLYPKNAKKGAAKELNKEVLALLKVRVYHTQCDVAGLLYVC